MSWGLPERRHHGVDQVAAQFEHRAARVLGQLLARRGVDLLAHHAVEFEHLCPASLRGPRGNRN